MGKKKKREGGLKAESRRPGEKRTVKKGRGDRSGGGSSSSFGGREGSFPRAKSQPPLPATPSGYSPHPVFREACGRSEGATQRLEGEKERERASRSNSPLPPATPHRDQRGGEAHPGLAWRSLGHQLGSFLLRSFSSALRPFHLPAPFLLPPAWLKPFVFTADLDLISIQLRHAVNAKREATSSLPSLGSSKGAVRCGPEPRKEEVGRPRINFFLGCIQPGTRMVKDRFARLFFVLFKGKHPGW